MGIYNYSGNNMSYNKLNPEYSGTYSIGRCIYESSLDQIRLDEAMLMSDFYEASLKHKDSVLESNLGAIHEGVIGNFFAMLKKMLTALGEKIKNIFTSIINAITSRSRDNKKALLEPVTVDINNPNIKYMEDAFGKTSKRVSDKFGTLNDKVRANNDAIHDVLNPKPKSPPKLLQMSLKDFLLYKDLSGIDFGLEDGRRGTVEYEAEINPIHRSLIYMRRNINLDRIKSDLNLDKDNDDNLKKNLKTKNTTNDFLSITPDEYQKKCIAKFLTEGESEDIVTFEDYLDHINSNAKTTRGKYGSNPVSNKYILSSALNFVIEYDKMTKRLQDLRRDINMNIDNMKKQVTEYEKTIAKSSSNESQPIPYIKAYVSGFDTAVQIMTNTAIRIIKDMMKWSNSIIAKAKAYNPDAPKQENAILIYESVADVHDEMDELFAI